MDGFYNHSVLLREWRCTKEHRQESIWTTHFKDVYVSNYYTSNLLTLSVIAEVWVEYNIHLLISNRCLKIKLIQNE